MSAPDFDLVVIGGGSGGYAGASLGAGLGMKVALVEGAREMGGLCILRGCMPSKTLIQSANRYMTLRRAKEFGLRAENISVRGEEIMERKRRLITEFGDYRRNQLEHGRFELVRGWGNFLDAHTLEVQGEEGLRQLRAKSFLVATGSSLKVIDLPGLGETGHLDSDTVLDSAHIPKSVIMLGAGPIALEFAHYYSALGSDVTIIQRGAQVLREMDGDVAMAASDALCARGVRLFLGTTLSRVERCAGGKRVVFQHEGAERAVEAEEIVYALGRAPNIGRLGLDAAGVNAPHGRLCAGATQQTNVPHIFAAGDAAGPHEIVHIAIQQAEVAVRNVHRLLGSGGELEKMDYRLKLFVAFMEPQVAAIGLTEQELMMANVPYAVARYAFADHGKAEVLGETDGFVKLIASPERCEILGAAAVGPEAGELIHELAAAMYFRGTAHDLLKIPHYHPTLSEIWTYPAEELAMAEM